LQITIKNALFVKETKVIKFKQYFCIHFYKNQKKRKKNNTIIGQKQFSVISKESVVDVFVKLNILIPFNSRCCRFHLTEGKALKDAEMHKLKVNFLN